MNNRISSAIWLAIALACGSALANDGIRWAPDVGTARRASAQFNVPLLVHFYGDNCLPCQTLEQRVYSRPELVDTLNKYFICVRINASTDRQAAAEFQVHSWPTDVFVSPDGKTLFQDTCKQDLNSYLGVLHNVAVMNRDRNVMLAAHEKAQPLLPEKSAMVNQQIPLTPGTLPELGSNRAGPNAVIPGTVTPGFYNSAGQPATQQLQESQSPNTAVYTGPLLAANQPRATTGAPPFANHMVSSPTAPQIGATPQGQLPMMTPPAIAPTATGPASPQHAMSAYGGHPIAQVPMPQANTTYGPSVNLGHVDPQLAIRAMTPSNNAEAMMVSNPYYPEPANMQMANQSVPQSTQPYQPPQPYQPAMRPPLPQATLPVTGSAMPNAAGQMVAHAPNRNESTNTTAAQQISFQPRMSSTTSINALPSSVASSPAEAVNLQPALEGYCVIKAKQGEWIPGRPEYAVQHRGQVYWLSDPQAQQQFLSNPDKAAPLLAGYDPMILLTQGVLVPGSINHTLHERVSNQLFLFASEESKQEYYPAGDPSRFEKNTRALTAILREAGVK